MAVPAFVGIGTNGTGSTSVAPGYPTVSAGNKILLLVVTRSGGTIVAPGGVWAVELAPTTLGSMTVAVYSTVATGSESGTQTINITTGDSSVGKMIAYSASAGNAVQVALVTTGGDAASDTSFAASGSSLTSVTNDVLLAVIGVSDDPALTSRSLTQSGATLGTQTVQANFGTTLGLDSRMELVDRPVTTGGTGAPSFSATATTSITGEVVFLVLREVASGHTLTPATVANAAVPLSRSRSRVLTAASTVNTAVALSRARSRTLTPAAQAAAAVALSRSRARSLTPAVQTGAAVPLTRSRARTLVPAAQPTAAVTLVRQRSRSVTPAAESDQAVPLTRTRIRNLVAAVETTVAVVLDRARSRALTPAIETDTTSPLDTGATEAIRAFAARLLRTVHGARLLTTPATGRLVPIAARGAFVQEFNDETRDQLAFEASIGRDLAGTTIELKVDDTWHDADWTAAAVEGTDDDGRPIWTRPALTDDFFIGHAHPDPQPGDTVLEPGSHATEGRATWISDGRTVAFTVETLYVQ